MEARRNDNRGADPVEGILEEAYAAARRGRTDEVDLLLARLQLHAPRMVDGLAPRLHAIARCVRDHPSYRGSAGADAPHRAAG